MYQMPIEMNIEADTKFLETDIQILWGYHVVCIHRNPDAAATLRGDLPANFRLVPYTMYSEPDARLAYILGMFSRVEQNTMFRMHRVTVVLEMVVELRLHGWPIDLILRAVHRRRRDGCESYSSVEALIKAAAKDQM